LNFDPVTQDTPVFDSQFPATNAPITFESNGARVFGVVLVAQGAGPHPTVLLLHGIPGNERNFDLAQALRRAGWNVVVFHYRGNWGSQGIYSFLHVLEDTRVAVAFLHSQEARDRYRVDGNRITLVGHSLGAFAALTTAAGDPDIRAVASIALYDLGAVAQAALDSEESLDATTRFLDEGAARLNGTTGTILMGEILGNGETFHLVPRAKELAGRSLLFIDASRDEIAPPALHHAPLAEALRGAGAKNLQHVTIESDHAFCDRRIESARVIVEWLEKQMRVMS